MGGEQIAIGAFARHRDLALDDGEEISILVNHET